MLAFIIFGTRGITRTAGSGPFFCPRCQCRQAFEHKQVRVWFTLYFIPIFPLHTSDEYIECTHCRSLFAMAVLQSQPGAGAPGGYSSDAREEFGAHGPLGMSGDAPIVAELVTEVDATSDLGSHTGPSEELSAERLSESLVRVLVLLSLADGQITARERAAITHYMSHTLGDSHQELIRQWEERLARAKAADYLAFLKRLAPNLSPRNKRLIVRGVWEVATAEHLSATKEELVKRTPQILEMPQDEFQAIIAQ